MTTATPTAASNSTPFAIPSSPSQVRVQDVGIHAIDIYFPSTYITQESLEEYNHIPAGKYTIGLGQKELAYVNDREDIYSMTLTAVANFMTKYNLSYADVGRLEVGTETILDHSKSIKSVVMSLFQSSGNTDIEGVDCMNACYAGTNALFNSCDWIESTSFDGRYAMVIAADIAEYAQGPARPTGGAGVVVMVLAPNAPLVIDVACRSTHMEHTWDFYKSNMQSPYPLVDGKFSNSCYLRALDTCYQRYLYKLQRQQQYASTSASTTTAALKTLNDFDHVVLHAPYNKLTQKAYARLFYNDFLLNPGASNLSSLSAFASIDKNTSYNDVVLEKALLSLSNSSYATKVGPATLLPTRLGNMYTASLYAGILSLLYNQAANLVHRHVLCFSYGSGLASSIFSFHVPETMILQAGTKRMYQINDINANDSQQETISTATLLKMMQQKLDLELRLASRHVQSCQDFETCMNKRESLHSLSSFVASDSIELLASGTYYLIEKDQQSRRQYQQKL